jgi:hypothetical protein
MLSQSLRDIATGCSSGLISTNNSSHGSDSINQDRSFAGGKLHFT